MTTQKPVAIRIMRPYQTEEEFFAAELETISRTGVTLVGAQQRPDGVVLRFELTLADGSPLIRGEGRVVGYKPNVIGGEPGLSLRFTRLDSKSKTLVDRVGSLRDARRSLPPPAMQSAPRVSEPPPAPTSSADLPHSVRDLSRTAEIQLRNAIPESSSPSVVKIKADPSREAVLARLRNRAVAPAEIERILADGASRRRH